MSGFLDDVRVTFASRMAAHEGMLHHLGLAPTEDDAPHLFHELRATLLACGSCRCPKTCLEWQMSGDPGSPPWCHQSGAFKDLLDACAALEARKAAQIAAEKQALESGQ